MNLSPAIARALRRTLYVSKLRTWHRSMLRELSHFLALSRALRAWRKIHASRLIASSSSLGGRKTRTQATTSRSYFFEQWVLGWGGTVSKSFLVCSIFFDNLFKSELNLFQTINKKNLETFEFFQKKDFNCDVESEPDS